MSASRGRAGPASGRGRLRALVAAVLAALVGLAAVGLAALRQRAATGGPDAAGGPGVEDHVHFVAFAPGSDGVLYVGTHGGLYRVTVGGGAGQSWQSLKLRGQDVMNIAVDPSRPGRVLVGGHDVLAVSEDGGETWRRVRADLPGSDIHGLTATARPGRVVAYVVGHGVFRSDDGGRRWERVGEGPPSGRVMALAADPRDAGRLYAGTMGDGVFRSEDGGRTWTPAGDGLGDGSVMALAVASGEPATVFAATGSGVFRSEDGGRSWRAVGGVPAEPVYGVAVNPARPAEIYGLAASGWYVSRDGGEDWSPLR